MSPNSRQALFTEEVRELRHLREVYKDDPLGLAKSYVDVFSQPVFAGTTLELSGDLNLEDPTELEAMGDFLARCDICHIGGTEDVGFLGGLIAAAGLAGSADPADPSGFVVPTESAESAELDQPAGLARSGVRHPQACGEVQHAGVVGLRQTTGFLYGERQVATVGTAILVSDHVLLTANHVMTTHDRLRVFLREAPPGQDYLEIRDRHVGLPEPADLAAVVLKDKAPGFISRVPIAAASEYDENSHFRSVGFGKMIRGVTAPWTTRNYVDRVKILSLSCETPQAELGYGCKPGMEVVAGELHKTACGNDSGGGLLVRVGGVWKLVGVITRGIEDGCDTAVRYARVEACREKLNNMLEGAGLPTFRPEDL